MSSRYAKLIEEVFFDNYRKGATEVLFQREELSSAAKKLGMDLPKNLGDVIYSMRYRTPLPDNILALQPKGQEWIIEGRGRAQYAFNLSKINRISPNQNILTTKVPDATPEIVSSYALSDEQALLAKVRYNRLIDIFLGITTFSLQNHLRTTVDGVGQIEVDEIYVGVDKNGAHYVVPVQAKGGADQIGSVQTKQDILFCAAEYSSLICRAVSAQFVSENLIAMFELTVQDDDLKLVNEKHYELASSSAITQSDLQTYRQLTQK